MQPARKAVLGWHGASRVGAASVDWDDVPRPESGCALVEVDLDFIGSHRVN